MLLWLPVDVWLLYESRIQSAVLYSALRTTILHPQLLELQTSHQILLSVTYFQAHICVQK